MRPAAAGAADDPAPAGGVVRRWSDRHPQALDLLIVAVVALLSCARLVHGAGWRVWVLSLLLVLPLAVRRRSPSRVFALVSLVALVQLLVGERLVADMALLVALYTVAALETRQRALAAAGVLEVGVVLASVRFAPAGGGVVGSIVFLSGLVTAALFIGTTQRTRRAYLASVVDRAARLEREVDQQARLAATAERTRIAREMHDIVAHSVSVIVTLADAAALANATDPPAATHAIQQVSATGRQALGEMRRLLGVLREDGADEEGAGAGLAPQPGLGELDTLLAQMREAGLPLMLRVTGQPAALPQTAETAVYRIVQESLTNVLKHSDSPEQVSVTMRWSDDWLTLDVVDDGGPVSSDAPVPGGHGLAGMRERVLVQSGQLHAGPRSRGGWGVHARLPLPRAG